MANQSSSPIPKRWKDAGYPVYSRLVGSDNELFLLRRFNTLNARIILGLQDRICELEQQLDALDEGYRTGDEDINNGSFRYETQRDRMDLLKKIKERLKEYNEFVALHADMKARPNVLPRQIVNLKNWHANNHNAILEEEQAYIQQDEDLITIVPIAKTPLRRHMEKTEWFRTSRWFRRQPPKTALPSHAPDTEEKNVFYHADAKIKALDSGLVMLMGLSMLVAPLWILYAVTANKDRLEVIIVFVTAFLALLQLVTVASPAEILAATAAYSAVLMVFIGGTS